jgi:hypothetical protein
LQQLRLQTGWQRRDLIQEQSAAVGQFDMPRTRRMRAGEGSLLMAEQLRLDQLLGQGGAIQAHEGRIAPGPHGHDGLGHQLLAGPALPPDHDAGIALRHALDRVIDPQHLLAAADQFPEGIPTDALLFTPAALDLHRFLVQRTVEDHAHIAKIRRRREVLIHYPRRLHPQLRVRAGRKRDHHQVLLRTTELFQHFQALGGRASCAVHVEDDGVEMVFQHSRDGDVGVRDPHLVVRVQATPDLRQGAFIPRDDRDLALVERTSWSGCGHRDFVEAGL